MRKVFYTIGCLIVIGLIFSFYTSEPSLGEAKATCADLALLQEEYFSKEGKYLQILEGGNLPDYETGTIVSKIGRNVEDSCVVDTHQYPDGTWGYTIKTLPVATST